MSVDLTGAQWRKSPYSGDANCVEVALNLPVVAVRDSKNPAAAALTFEPGAWRSFVAGVRDGEIRR